MMLVDASVWVARLLPADVHHERCKLWMREQVREAEIFAAPELLLAELAGAIARRTGSPQLAKQTLTIMLQIPELRLLKLQGELVGTAAQLAAEYGLRGADAFYSAAALQLSIPLITLDADQHERTSRFAKSTLLA
jgi:predicted nucleic acid-binding protein